MQLNMPLNRVILRVEILEVDLRTSRTSLEGRPETGPEGHPETGPEGHPETGPEINPKTEIFPVKRPYEPI